MDEDIPPQFQRRLESLERGATEETNFPLEWLDTAAVNEKKAVIQSLEALVDDDRALVEPLSPVFTSLLDAEDRSVRLTTAKLLVSIAETDPGALHTLVPTLAARVADQDEFYYVRARSAEALGYIALEHPDEVASPELLADLRIGLSFDEPEVKRKLAKALEHVALGDPRRLRHHVSSLAEHLDDDDELVRYHLCSALVVVGAADPERLTDVAERLIERLDDDCPFVQGRAAEALGQLNARDFSDHTIPTARLAELRDATEPFVVDRATFASSSLESTDVTDSPSTTVGTVESVRAETDSIATEIKTPDTDGNCPSCGFPLPEAGPPMCPQCGSPH